MACKRSSVRPRYSPQRLTKCEPFPFMSFVVYIIYSASLDQFYIGHTHDLQERLFRHKNSGSKATKRANDWVLKYTEEFFSRSEAVKRELAIKNKKSRKYIELLISSVAGASRKHSGRRPVRIRYSPQRFTENEPFLFSFLLFN